MKVIISDMTDIFSVGFSPELDRSESMLQPALDSYSDVTPSGVSGSISPTNLSSGAMASILFSGKETFTSTTAGYRMGIDLSDDIYKWVIGSSASSIDWAVTTAGTLTITGAGIVSPSISYGKTSFTDSTNAGYFLSSLGVYIGSASDVSVLKYTIASGVFDFIGTVSSRSTATLASAINSSGNVVTDLINARIDSSAKTILSDFNFGATNYAGAVKSGDITWNTTTGAITGGSGVVVYRGGIIGAAAGVATFSINASTGAATFAGLLSAPTGSIGGWTIGASTLSAVSGGNTTTLSSGATSFSSGPTGLPTVTITQAGVISATGAIIDGTSTIGGRTGSALALAIDASANLVTDLINARIDSSAKTILSDFNFGAVNYAGAVKSGDIAWNTTTGAVTGGSGVVVYRGGIVGAAAGVTTFSIDATTGSATFAGTLSAPSGDIGGYLIGADYLRDAANSFGLASTVTGGDDVRFWAGDTFANRATAPLRITESGAIVATSATINGSSISNQHIFGSGVDSDATITGGTTTLTTDKFYNDLTITGTGILVTNGYRVFVKGTLTINASGVIKWNGNDGSNGGNWSGSSGGTGGGGGTALTSGSLYGSPAGIAGSAGGAGTIATNSPGNPGGTPSGGTAITNSFTSNVSGSGGNGGTGGASTLGQPGGTGTAASGGSITASTIRPYAVIFGVEMFDKVAGSSPAFLKYNGNAGGAAGGGGGGCDGPGGASGPGGGAGGGGSNGGTVVICAKTIVNNGSIQSVGGIGGAGGNADGGSGNGGPGAGGGGGRGGHGGAVVLIYSTLSGSGTVSVAGGASGSGGLKGSGGGSTAATDGQTPSSGGTGAIIQLQV